MRHPAETAVEGLEKSAWIGTALMLGLPFLTTLAEKFMGGGGQAAQQQQQMMTPWAQQGQHGMGQQLGHTAGHYAAHSAPQYGKPALARTAKMMQRFRGF